MKNESVAFFYENILTLKLLHISILINTLRIIQKVKFEIKIRKY